MSRIDEAIASVAYILDCLMTYRNAIESGDCNSCKNKDCKWKPKPGQLVRYNCPHYKREGNPMDDYIGSQALCQYALNQKDKSVTPNDIMRFPSADVAPVVHGKWIPQKENYEFKEAWMKCSACGYPVSRWTGNTNFCPNCGAKMDGERKENCNEAD